MPPAGKAPAACGGRGQNICAAACQGCGGEARPGPGRRRPPGDPGCRAGGGALHRSIPRRQGCSPRCPPWRCCSSGALRQLGVVRQPGGGVPHSALLRGRGRAEEAGGGAPRGARQGRTGGREVEISPWLRNVGRSWARGGGGARQAGQRSRPPPPRGIPLTTPTPTDHAHTERPRPQPQATPPPAVDRSALGGAARWRSPAPVAAAICRRPGPQPAEGLYPTSRRSSRPPPPAGIMPPKFKRHLNDDEVTGSVKSERVSAAGPGPLFSTARLQPEGRKGRPAACRAVPCRAGGVLPRHGPVLRPAVTRIGRRPVLLRAWDARGGWQRLSVALCIALWGESASTAGPAVRSARCLAALPAAVSWDALRTVGVRS